MMNTRAMWLVPLSALLVTLAGMTGEPAAQEVGQTSYRLQASVMGSAGSPTAGGAARVNATMGQPTPIGAASVPGRVLYAGFWSRPWELASVLEEGGLGVVANCLYPNSPNPFRRATTIAYAVEKQTTIEIALFDVRGRKVRTLASGPTPPGRYAVTFNATDDRGERISPGVYFYRLDIGDWRSVKKMIVLD